MNHLSFFPFDKWEQSDYIFISTKGSLELRVDDVSDRDLVVVSGPGAGGGGSRRIQRAGLQFYGDGCWQWWDNMNVPNTC